MFPTLCALPVVIDVPPRIGRSKISRPQDLETRYWLRVPFNGFSRSVRDVAATALTVDHLPFGDGSVPLHTIYTIFYLDQVSPYGLSFFFFSSSSFSLLLY